MGRIVTSILGYGFMAVVLAAAIYILVTYVL